MKKSALSIACLIALLMSGSATAQKAPTQAPPPPPSPAQAQPKEGEYFIPIDQTDPGSVITAYFKLSAMNRIQDASVLLGPIFQLEDIQKITQEMVIFSKMVNDGEISVNLLETKQQGDWALAILLANMTSPEGKKKRVLSEQYMVKLGGKWRVVPTALRQAPSFSSFIDSDAIALFNYWSENKAKLEKKYLK